ncbi:sugar kinase [Secundilactobacillus odoratitofui DSM 19909 = JCM 15043]|uniref:ADP-dependent (S)-NAD(P)H-hydrate dehydratase n=1 Tax=Secundilactobacillus odoratitofui DSM 19909 = JCM 15043 TaxID=1423776 RepID=A0A0R1LQC2_9LACO|nr:NAD(P)H-hydrate dehydratase [Secundilactobacillus odoratitofui]KRK97728.1 sugar kinase [Secundilactobacillus odoratitofui DSM 19909 = JCM 15043]
MKQLTEAILAQTIRVRPAESHKGTYGRVCLIGGNAQFGGAILMATEASVYSGAGLNTTLTDPSNFVSLHARLPEAMVADFTDQSALSALVTAANTVVIGPGLGTDATSLDILTKVFRLVSSKQTLIIDGSAITLVAKHDLALPSAQLVFTPHQMEWQRLTGIKIADQTDDANETARTQLMNGTVVLKSHQTKIYTPTGSYLNTTGTPAQATGGMGDTLAGMIAGFTAQFTNQTDAILAAVYAHSDIADLLAKRQYVVLPTQIIQQLPSYMYNHQHK